MEEKSDIIKSAREIAMENAEKIAKEVSPAELEKIELLKNGANLANKFFAEQMELKELIANVEKHKEKEEMARIVQATLVERIPIEKDYDRITKAVLEFEKKKKSGNYKKYSSMESILHNEIKMLQQQYSQIKKQGFEEIKVMLTEKVSEVTKELEQTRGAKVDIQKSVETTASSSQEWRDFLAKLNLEFEGALNNYKKALTELIGS